MKLVEIAKGLAARGHHPIFIAPESSRILLACRDLNIPHLAVSPRFKYLDIFTAMKLRRILSPHDVDVIIVGISKDISTCALTKKIAGVDVLVFIQQMQFGISKKGPFHQWTYGAVDYWITLTNAMRGSVLEHTTILPERIKVIPFGSDLDRFDPSKYDREECRQMFGLPADRFIIAGIGRLDRQKGQHDLIRAFLKVHRNHPSVHLVIVGDETQGEPGYRSELEELVQQHGLQSSVQFIPHTSAVPELLAAIDLFVLPSLSETFGYIVVEAMAMGKPVVATDAGGVPEIVADGMTGMLAKASDPGDLAQKINMLIENEALRTTIAYAARKHALEFFDMRNQIRTLEETLLGLVRQQH